MWPGYADCDGDVTRWIGLVIYLERDRWPRYADCDGESGALTVMANEGKL